MGVGVDMQKEFDRLVLTCETDKVKLPSKRALEKKRAQLDKLAAQRWTEVRERFFLSSFLLS